MEVDMQDMQKHVVDVDGVIASGRQFDLDITPPDDKRNVIYGIVRDHDKHPIKDAVVKLIEVFYKDGKSFRAPVSHTFTDKEGEFVFGPLCPDKRYEIQIWVDNVKHHPICVKPCHDFDCLKGTKFNCHKRSEEEEEECKEE